jgi:lysophospholipase L1-like esterase
MMALSLAAAAAHGVSYDPNVLPKGEEYFKLREGLQNCRAKFENEKSGRVAFLGGSITAMSGWREQLMAYLRQKFPGTQFEFIGAGIGSLGSVAHAFRLEQDVLSKGPIDLLFVEAAVNDTANTGKEPERMLRGMEGVVRHARRVNPMTDIVQMHFAMPPHFAEFKAGRVPVAIAQHEKVAEAYGNPSLNLSREVYDRIAAGEFEWEKDFVNLHPSPFGHKLYVNSMARMLDAAWAKPAAPKRHPLPEQPLDSRSYSNGRYGALETAKLLKGFTLVKDWQPTLPAKIHPKIAHLPALTAREPGAEFEFSFEGQGVGLLLSAGPDAGVIEAAWDGGPWNKVDTFKVAGIYLPRAIILDDTLEPGPHVVKIRLTAERNANSIGTALHVLKLLEN